MNTKYYLLLLMVLGISSCTSYKSIMVDLRAPGKVVFPASVSRVAVVDNSARIQSEEDISFEENQVAKTKSNYLEALSQFLRDEQFFQEVYLDSVALRTDTIKSDIHVIGDRSIKSILSRNNTDALIALDYYSLETEDAQLVGFDYDLRLSYIAAMLSIYGQEGKKITASFIITSDTLVYTKGYGMIDQEIIKNMSLIVADNTTILINPFMSCTARLPVFILLSGIFFGKYAPLALFALYIIGILLAILSAKLFKRFLFKSEETPFIMEFPPYRLPTIKSTVIHMWDKSKEYLKKMGGIILVASIIIWFLQYFPKNEELLSVYDSNIEKIDHEFVNNKITIEEKNNLTEEQEHLKNITHQENSYIGKLGRVIEPVVRPLGFDWKIGVSLLTGLAAKEVVMVNKRNFRIFRTRYK